ncbi:MAG: radical SAM protein [Peptococcaceae bacterium]|nr:radical SAM protein [Peptococcaceae bacterium]
MLLATDVVTICTSSTAENPYIADKCLPNFKHNFNEGNKPQIIDKVLSAPETVHLAVTYRCHEDCPDCYARNYASSGELDTAAMCGIIDDIARQSVFQLAIGGGEPFLRSDLRDIVCYATNKGLVTHITTGKYSFDSRSAEVLRYVKSLHVGIRSESLVMDTTNTVAELRGLVDYAAKADVLIGANLIMTRFTIQNLPRLVELMVLCGFQRLIFLRYKPINNITRWQRESPNKDDWCAFEGGLLYIKHQYPHLMIRLDCASAFMMKKVGNKAAFKAGIKGCVAGDRIISVSPDGLVYPCSQLVGPEYKAGNLALSPLGTIWRDSDVLNHYRQFRQSASFAHSACGTCIAKDFCGGCRLFAEDDLGGEPICPLRQNEEVGIHGDFKY